MSRNRVTLDTNNFEIYKFCDISSHNSVNLIDSLFEVSQNFEVEKVLVLFLDPVTDQTSMVHGQCKTR